MCYPRCVFIGDDCLFVYVPLPTFIEMNVQDGWVLINQALRLQYYNTDSHVWLATRAWELTTNHVRMSDIEFRLNGTKLTPTPEFTACVTPKWNAFLADARRDIDVQGVIVFTVVRLMGGMSAPVVLPPETYELYVRHNFNTVSNEYKVTRVLPNGAIATSSGNGNINSITPITMTMNQVRPDFAQNFPGHNEHDTTVYVMGGFGYDPTSMGVMNSRVSRYDDDWQAYMSLKVQHGIHILNTVNPQRYVKMAQVPQHVMANAVFSDVGVQIGNLAQNSPASRDADYQKRQDAQFRKDQKRVDELNRQGGLLVPEDMADTEHAQSSKAVMEYLAHYNLLPLPPGTDLVSAPHIRVEFNMREAREEITAIIASAYGTTPALWEQSSNMKGNVKLFEEVLSSTVSASMKITMGVATKIFNEIHMGATYSQAVLANYEYYMRPEMERILIERMLDGRDGAGQTSPSFLPFPLKETRSNSDDQHSRQEEARQRYRKYMAMSAKRMDEDDEDDEDTTTKKRKKRGGKGGRSSSSKKQKRKMLTPSAGDNVDDIDNLPSTVDQIMMFAMSEADIANQVKMFVENVPERERWTRDNLLGIRDKSLLSSYTLTMRPYANPKTNAELMEMLMMRSITGEELILRQRAAAGLHPDDMSVQQLERSARRLEELRDASCKDFMAAQMISIMRDVGVVSPHSDGHTAQSANRSNSDSGSGMSTSSNGVTEKKKHDASSSSSGGKDTVADKSTSSKSGTGGKSEKSQSEEDRMKKDLPQGGVRKAKRKAKRVGGN